jgi:hypothetical protein
MGVPAPLDTLLVRGICAYRYGRALPVRMSDGPSGALFRDLGQALIRSRLADDQYAHYLAIRDLARAAVTRARNGDIPGAEARFADAEAHLAAVTASDESQLLARSWIDQAYAYLAVRRRDWQTSRDRLDAAMRADLALEEQFGYELFHIGRVHTLHLRARTEAEAGNLAEAIALCQAIADYAMIAAPTLPLGSGWSRERAEAVPEDLRLAMTARICSEAGAVIARADQNAARDLFAAFPAWQGFAAHERLGEIHQWGLAKRAYLDGDTAAFLTQAEPVLAAGRGETTLWYATTLDLCRTLHALRATATSSFREEVRDDVRSWRALPSDVQAPALFGLLAHEQPHDRSAAYHHRTPARRLRLFTVGLPRTGTTSIFTLFEGYRSGNEFMERETITRLVARHTGRISRDEFAAYLDRRDREGGLEVDAASFHHLYFDELLPRYPDARFLCTIRSPYEWANSYVKMVHGWHQKLTAAGEPLPGWMEQYGQMLFGDFSWTWVASHAAIAERVESLADAFLRHWADANRRTLALLPPERSLVIRTEELSARRADIERFAGLAPRTLRGSDHSNVHPDRTDLLAPLGREWVEARARAYGADVLARVELIAA